MCKACKLRDEAEKIRENQTRIKKRFAIAQAEFIMCCEESRMKQADEERAKMHAYLDDALDLEQRMHDLMREFQEFMRSQGEN